MVCQELVRCVPLLRQTRMSVGRRVVMVVLKLRLHASGGDGEGVLVGTCGFASRCAVVGHRASGRVTSSGVQGLGAKLARGNSNFGWMRLDYSSWFAMVLQSVLPAIPTVYELDAEYKVGDIYLGRGWECFE